MCRPRRLTSELIQAVFPTPGGPINSTGTPEVKIAERFGLDEFEVGLVMFTPVIKLL
jgi:hypothetical protein